MRGLLLLSLLLTMMTPPIAALVPEDRVTQLPYFDGTAPFEHYSGYLSAGSGHGEKYLHYWLVESESSPATDPLVLWLNGGPGCSSLYGMFMELGPFQWDYPGEELNLYLNPFGWHKIANMLFIESPVGVGFSYSTNTNDYTTNDTQTATDNYFALQQFFELYPEYSGREFYISGESYAGMYIPMLAEEIRLGNAEGEPHINIQGILVGNGVTDPESDSVYNSLAPFAHGHGFISDETYGDIEQCNGGATPNDPRCIAGLATLSSMISGVNRYQVYEECYHHGDLEKELFTRLEWPESILGNIPCIDTNQAEEYFNDASVKEAIHVVSSPPSGRWVICSDVLRYSKNLGSNSFQFYPGLIDAGIRAITYNGDTDGAVPYVGPKLWSKKLGLDVVDEWRPWIVNDQVAGYVVQYEQGFSFATIKGGWHTVPESHPEESLHMLKQFLENEPL